MNSTIESIYQIFRTNLGLVAKEGKSSEQYKPHLCFEMCGPEIAEMVEINLPQLLLQGNFEKVAELVQNLRKKVESVQFTNSKRSYQTYGTKFLDFIEKVTAKGASPMVQKVRDEIIAVCKIDGNDELVRIMGGEKAFIKKAISESYFFHLSLAVDRFEIIASWYHMKHPIPARKQGREEKKGIAEQCNYPQCQIDPDGNKAVRDMIERLTGYSVSAGAKSTLKNYKISHIWGEAFNPRYFTNLWNLVLVPAWANDILDKKGSKGTLAAKFLATIKAVCIMHYHMADVDWGKIDMNFATDIELSKESKEDIVKGLYDFHVIHGVAPGSNFKGEITTSKVRL